MADFQKVKLTNVDKGPRGVNTAAGPVVVDSGQTVEVEANADEIASVVDAGWFKKGGAAEKAETDDQRVEREKRETQAASDAAVAVDDASKRQADLAAGIPADAPPSRPADAPPSRPAARR